MYRSCIFCSADLKANDALERFPVGRSLAFDGDKGRLWAVCQRCARWNLAPIQERWEAIEDAERLFADTRTRVQRESIGLAKLRDGTRLIRVGAALSGELAVWRYGESLVRRRRRHLLTAGPAAAGMLLYSAGLGALAAGGAGTIYVAGLALSLAMGRRRGQKVIYEPPRRGADDGAEPIRLRQCHLPGTRLSEGKDGVELHITTSKWKRQGLRFSRAGTEPLVLRGDDARIALGRAMAAVNAAGGTRRTLDGALDVIQRAGSPDELLLSAARQRRYLDGARSRTSLYMGQAQIRKHWDTPFEEISRRADPSRPSRLMSLAVEMSLHEEMERRALDGELAALEEMWRQAEEIAAIADRLPDTAA